jgi:hypothetical protein
MAVITSDTCDRTSIDSLARAVPRASTARGKEMVVARAAITAGPSADAGLAAKASARRPRSRMARVAARVAAVDRLALRIRA